MPSNWTLLQLCCIRVPEPCKDYIGKPALASMCERTLKQYSLTGCWLEFTTNLRKIETLFSLPRRMTINCTSYVTPSRTWVQCDQIWQNIATLAAFLNLCQIVEGLFSVWQNFEPTLAKLLCFGAASQCCEWPNMKNNIAIWSHWTWH